MPSHPLFQESYSARDVAHLVQCLPGIPEAPVPPKTECAHAQL